jgi:hypothetical protein
VAWATLDNDLTVREVRDIVSTITDGATVEEALTAHGVTPGEITIQLEADVYRELRRRAARNNESLGAVVSQALVECFEE